MARQLSLTMGEPVFQVQYRVIYGDTDAAAVVYNANYLRYFEIGRTEMMRSQGLPYSKIEELGCILPVTESYLRYKAPARYDDLITISTCLAEVKKVSCRFHYAITRENEDAKDTLLVRGFTCHACTDMDNKLVPLPEVLVEKITPLVAVQNK